MKISVFRTGFGRLVVEGAQLGGFAGGVGLVADGGDPVPAQADQVVGGLAGSDHVVEDAVGAAFAQADQRRIRPRS